MPTLRTILAGDIGATKTALALFDVIAGRPLRLAKQATFVSRDYPSLEAILGKFTAARAVLARACFGVAGPVEHGIAHLTNLPWVVDEQALAAALRTPSVSVINDLQAAAYGMLFVDPTQFAVLHAGPGAALHATLAVIAPGTGLGEALLFWDGERYHAVASEGGHADFAPETDQEIELLRCLRQRFGHVSYERILSGDGIANVYAFLRKHDSEPAWLAERLAHGDRNAAITEIALAGQDRACVEAVDMFCAILGAEASNLALKGLATGGVIIGGGIAPKILPALQRGGLIARFTDKGRFSDWVGKLDLRVALDPRAPLLGAANWTIAPPEPMAAS
jgi:glucokinase